MVFRDPVTMIHIKGRKRKDFDKNSVRQPTQLPARENVLDLGGRYGVDRFAGDGGSLRFSATSMAGSTSTVVRSNRPVLTERLGTADRCGLGVGESGRTQA
jgi:hypothetical protein